MSVVRGIVIIVACALCFGLAGGLLGLTLGIGAPGYYRGVFRAADDPGFNPVQVGLGLGISQGLICGAAIGSVVVLAVALSRRRRQKGEPIGVPAPQTAPDRPRSTRIRRILILVAVLAATACGGLSALWPVPSSGSCSFTSRAPTPSSPRFAQSSGNSNSQESTPSIRPPRRST